MHITIPKLSLVVLIGPSGSGKSTFARKHFLPTEVLSSDACRGMVSDDENNQAVTNDAFEVLHFIAAQAAGAGPADRRRCHQRAARGPQAARRAGPASTTACRSPSCSTCPSGSARSATAPGTTGTSARTSSASSSRNCAGRCVASAREGFRHVFVLETPEEVEAADDRAGAAVERQAAGARAVRHHRRRSRLLRRTGSAARAAGLSCRRRWTATIRVWGNRAYAHPEGRKAVFVGDLVDRGPRILDTRAARAEHGRSAARPCACPATTT